MSKTLRDWRIERDITQEALAKTAGLSPAVINRMEGGKAIARSSFTLVCQALGLAPEDITGVKIQSRVGIGGRRRA